MPLITRRQQLGTESPPHEPEQPADDDGQKPLEVGAPAESDLPSYGTKAPRAKGKAKAKAKAKAKTEANGPKAAARKSRAKKKLGRDAPHEACSEAGPADAPQDDSRGHAHGHCHGDRSDEAPCRHEAHPAHGDRPGEAEAPCSHEVHPAHGDRPGEADPDRGMAAASGMKAPATELEVADPKDPPSRKRPKQDAEKPSKRAKNAKKVDPQHDAKAKETKAKCDTNEDPGESGENAPAAPAVPGAKNLKTWAGRYVPTDPLGANRFLAMRDVYMQFVAPKIKAQSRHQDRWLLPLTLESL